MLSEVGWVVVVWVIWTALFALVMTLVRFTMFGQQEIAAEQEAEIIAAQTGQSVEAARAAEAAVGVEITPASPTESAMRWALRLPQRHAGPPTISPT